MLGRANILQDARSNGAGDGTVDGLGAGLDLLRSTAGRAAAAGLAAAAAPEGESSAASRWAATSMTLPHF